MATSENQLAASMRKIAAALRAEAEQHEKAHIEKCAQILLAARGLGSLQQLLKGASNAGN